MPVYAGVAELADALDLGSSAARRVGSSPSARTIIKSRALLEWQAVFLPKMGRGGKRIYNRENRKF